MKANLKSRSVDVVGVENISLGERLRTLRELKEMTQNDLQKTSGVRQAVISAIECGKKPMDLVVARKLAQGLAVPLSILVLRSSDEQSSLAAYLEILEKFGEEANEFMQSYAMAAKQIAGLKEDQQIIIARKGTAISSTIVPAN